MFRPPAATYSSPQSATISTLAVSWSASEGATSYQLYRDTAVAWESPITAYDGPLTQLLDGGLSPETTYHYRVRAKERDRLERVLDDDTGGSGVYDGWLYIVGGVSGGLSLSSVLRTTFR